MGPREPGSVITFNADEHPGIGLHAPATTTAAATTTATIVVSSTTICIVTVEVLGGCSLCSLRSPIFYNVSCDAVVKIAKRRSESVVEASS